METAAPGEITRTNGRFQEDPARIQAVLDSDPPAPTDNASGQAMTGEPADEHVSTKDDHVAGEVAPGTGGLGWRRVLATADSVAEWIDHVLWLGEGRLMNEIGF